MSYRVRKTDYISDVLWDNGWNSYSAADKVISAYSLTVDHTAAINSVNHPDGAEGNYVETNATYQHTIQTLIGTFTIKQGETTFEDLSYWFTANIDTTATFIINNNGTISIDSDNTFHLEGRAIKDLGLGISTVTQSWTTGLEETKSTASVTYAAKMTDYISDTFTSSQWANVNKTISVYSNNVDHVNGTDGNSVYQVTIQTKLTDITITDQMTFNQLRDKLAAYDITLSMVDGVVTIDSSKANYLVEDVFQNISYANGVTVLSARTSSTNGTTSMLQHFGITYDTISQSWTTGTAATESTGTVNYVIKMTDYISDTFTASEWAKLASYKDSAGNTNAGNVIAIMHAELNHSTQTTVITRATTVTINTNTTFQSLANTLANWGITLSIDNGVLKLDSNPASAHSNNAYYIEGSIPAHYGVKYDTITQNWTTGIEMTKSTGAISYNADNDDYVRNMFTTSGWNNINKVLTVKNMYYDYTNHKTVTTTKGYITVQSSWTIADLNSALAGYGISCSVDNGKVSLDSANGNWVEGELATHMGFGNNTISQTCTWGLTATSTGSVYGTINASDTLWDHLYGSWDSLGKSIVVKNETMNYSTGNVDTSYKTFNVDTSTTFQGLINLLSSNSSSNLSMSISNGKISMTGSNNYYATGDILTALGIGTTTSNKTWTYAQLATSTSALTYSGLTTSDKISDIVGWENISDKNIYVVNQYFNRDTQSMVYTTVKTISTSDLTVSGLNDNTKGYGINISANGNAVTLSNTNSYYYIDGAMVNFLGLNPSGSTQTTTVGKSVTGSKLTATATGRSKMTDFGISSSGQIYVWYYDSLKGDRSLLGSVTVGSNTFDSFVTAVKNIDSHVSASFSNGKLTFSTNGYNRWVSSNSAFSQIADSTNWTTQQYTEKNDMYTDSMTYKTTTVTGSSYTTTTTTSTHKSITNYGDWITMNDDYFSFTTMDDNGNCYDGSFYMSSSWFTSAKNGSLNVRKPNGCEGGYLIDDDYYGLKIYLFAGSGENADKYKIQVTVKDGYYVHYVGGSAAKGLREDMLTSVKTTTTTTTVNTLTTTTVTASLDSWAWNNVAISNYGYTSNGKIELIQYYTDSSKSECIRAHSVTLNVSSTQTLSQIAAMVSSYGVTFERSGDKLHMASSGGKSGNWIWNCTPERGTYYFNYHYNGTAGTVSVLSSSTCKSDKFTKTADSSTLLDELGWTTGTDYKIWQAKIYSSNVEGSGTISTNDIVNVDWSDTLGQIVDKLNAQGLGASLSGGKLTISQSGRNYISGVNNTSIASILGLPTSGSSYYTTKTWTKYSNATTGSNKSQYITDNNITRATLGAMGYNAQTLVKTTHNNSVTPESGSTTSISWAKTTSLYDFLQTLRNNGFTATFNSSTHKVTVSSNGTYSYYLSSNGANNPLKLSTPYTTKTVKVTSPTAQSNTVRYCTIHGATTLSDVNIGSNQTISFICHQNGTYSQDTTTANGHVINNTNATYTVTWTTGETFESFMNKINNSSFVPFANYDCSIKVDTSTGKVTLYGNNNAYVSSISSDLKTKLNIGSTYQTSTYNIVNEAKSTKTGLLTYLNANTRLGDMTINSAQTIDIVLHNNYTYVQDNTKASNVTHTIKVTWNTGESLQTFINRINTTLNSEKTAYGFNYGLTVNINEADRKIEITGNEYTYVSNISSALANYMKVNTKENGTYGKSYKYTINYRADADTVKDYTYMNERNTKLHNMSISTAQTMTFVVHTNNTFAQNQTDGLNVAKDVTKTITVTWTTSQTLAQFEASVNSKLNTAYNQVGVKGNTGKYGITFSVNAENGKLKILGNEYTYLYDVSDPLENFIKLTGDKKENGTYGQSYNYSIIYRADADSQAKNGSSAIDYTYLNERNTTLYNLSYVNGSGQTISTNQSQTMDIVIHINNTYAQDNTKSEIQQKALSSGSTIYITTTVGKTQSSSSAVTYYESVIATATSTFAELGINTSQAISVYNGNKEKLGEFYMSSASTLHDFFTAIHNINADATATINNGVITLSDGFVLGTVATALGLKMETYNSTTTANKQTSATAVTYDKDIYVSEETTLAELGFNTNSSTELFDKYGIKLGDFSLDTSATVGDFIASINALSTEGNASIKNGILTINSGYVEGFLAQQFKLNRTDSQETSIIALDTVSTAGVFYTTTAVATATTTFEQLGINTDNQVSVYDKYGNFVTGINVQDDSTLQDLVNKINSAVYSNGSATGIQAAVNGSTITISSGYIEGDIASALGMSKADTKQTVTAALSTTSTAAVTYITSYDADENTTFKEFGLTGTKEVKLYDTYGNEIKTFSINESSTINNLLAAINDATSEGNAKLTNNVLSLTNGYISGEVADLLGLSVKSSNVSITVAKEATSSVVVTDSNGNVATGATLLSELGMTNNNRTIKTKSGAIVTVSSTTTVGELVSKFNNIGITASFRNGILTLGNANDSDYVSTDSASILKNYFYIETGLNKTSEKIPVTKYTSGKSTLQISETHIIDENTTFRDLGMKSNNDYFNTNNDQININLDSKIIETFADAGLTLSVDQNGFVSITGDDSHYITKDTRNVLKNYFNIAAGNNSTYSTSIETVFSGKTGTVAVKTTHTINADTSFKDIGLTTDSYFDVVDRLTNTTTRVNTTKDSNILETFKNAGFSLTVDAKGYVTISSDDGNKYISAIRTNTAKTLANTLKTNFGENYSWGYDSTDIFASSSSDLGIVTAAKTINADTTLADLGLTNANIVIGGNTNYTFNIHSNDKVLTALAKLQEKGINVSLQDGKLTFESTNGNFIKSMNQEFSTLLNISVGEGFTYTTNHPYGSSKSSKLYANEFKSISDSTTLANLGIANATIVTNQTTVKLTGTDSIVQKLKAAGLSISIANGKISISGSNSTYITSMSDNLKNALKISVGENNTWVKNVDEQISNGDISAVTRTITVTWTYGALGTEDSQAKPETLKQFLNDINTSLAQATTQYRSMFNLSEDFTLSAYVDGNGQFHFTGDEYTYVSRVDDFLANALKIKSVTKEGATYGKSYSYKVQYANNSNNKTQYTYVNYDNMRLQNFDITKDQYITIVTHNNTTFAADATDDRIVKNGTVLFDNTTSTYVITWTVGTTGHTKQGNGYNNNDNAIRDGETFEELLYELKNFGVVNNLNTEASAVLGQGIYGIYLTINSDRTISLVGNEYTYIEGISQDLQNIFKIQNQVGDGHYYSSYDYKIAFNDDGYTDKVNTTLLNYDTRLDNLSIKADMTMTLETPEGGKSIIIDHDTTMQELKERLFSDYGIDVTIENKTGRITFTPTLANEGYYILGMDTELKDALKIITGENGVYTVDSEQIIATNKEGVYTTTTVKNVTTTAGTYGTSTIDNYDNTASRNLRFEDDSNIVKLSTRISRLNGYDNGNGNIIVHYADGLEQTISIRESMSVGQLCSILQDYGVTTEILAGGRITFKSNDGTYIKSADGGSNLLDVLNMSDFSIKVEGTTVITSKTLNNTIVNTATYFATEDTLLSTYAEGLLEANGVITFAINDKYKSVTITSDDTFGTLIQKFKDKGLNAKIEAGTFSISSGFDTFSIIQGATTSNLSAIIKLNEKLDLGGFAMTDRSKTIISTTTITDTKSMSIANFADEDTELGMFNIIGGTLSLYADGKKAGIQISSSDTLKTLQNKFRNALGQNINGPDDENVTLKFEDGYLKIYQNDTNIIVGSNEDTSNFAAITGVFSNNGTAESTRRFYKVNEYSKVTEEGLFRNGTVTAGDFVIGDATITIDNDTTIGELVSQINTNPNSNVTAYWDSIDGELKIKSNNTGNFYINFESGSSNFTDVLGFTKSSYNSETDTTTSSINTDVQKHGKNARVTINGATYTSVSNTMGSDVTGLKGLTINLKGMSAGEATILSVKKDVQSLALAVSDVVDAYNALIDNINTALSSKSELRNDSELKRLRNQIKSIMTGTNKNSSIFKNIVAIGIVTDTANPTNLSVGSGIYKLTLDYEKFAKAFEADSESVRTLLIGRVDEDGNVIEEGILTRLEALIDESIDSAGGYFERTEESFDRQINRLDNKIVKGTAAIEKYRERLEKKYMSMNILNSNIQTQYQVYFNG